MTILGLSIPLALVCVALAYTGAAVQASLGIGLGMLAAPIMAIIDPAFVPSVIVITVLPLSVAVAIADRRHIETRGFGLALAGRVPGVVVGAVVVARLSDTLLAVLVAGAVMLGVVASITSKRFLPRPSALVGAGFASGFAGTSVGIGGPPMALTYQHDDRARMRSTLAAFFSIGSMMSLLALAVAGEIGTREWQLSVLVLPAVVLGWATSRRYQHRIPAESIRPIVLALCAFAAVTLLIRSL